jgi:tRNA-specific 2-thiouridylase
MYTASSLRPGAKILVGLSGGVDSSVSAALLQEQGYQVTAGFIKNWSDTKDLWTGECGWRAERRDALRVAAKLGISLLTFDFEKEYRALVLDRMFSEYQAGLTPNPDVLCNEEVKFGLFFRAAMRLGFDGVATGHYAQVVTDTAGVAHLLKGRDPNKDQSYFLHRLSQEALARTLFPIGHLLKSEVRAEAERFSLSTAQKPDSQGICFVGKIDFHEFLRKKIAPTPGDIVTSTGEVVGRHDGLDAYTIGQRQGLQVSKDQRSWYVAVKNHEKNQLIIVPDREHPLLFSSSACLTQAHWLSSAAEELAFTQSVQVSIRYRQTPQPARLERTSEGIRVIFLEPVWALAPGQSAVFYFGEECLGGGFLA